MSDLESAKQAAERDARSPFGGALDALAERVGGSASARAVFGEPVERDGVTVIPVAKVRWGFGAGGGGGSDKEGQHGEGGGGGGGASAAPVGFIEVTSAGAVYQPIRDPASVAPVIIAACIGAWFVLRALRKLLR